MARILIGSWMIRFPLGGNLSWSLQWLLGFHRLGHDVYLVEKATDPESCFDPSRSVMTNDCTYGVQTVSELLAAYGMRERWCFVDSGGVYYGLSRRKVEELFRGADLYLDLGSHGAWLEEAASSSVRVLVDGEPGATQIKLVQPGKDTSWLQRYDAHYSNGANLANGQSSAPTAGINWRAIYNPVVPGIFPHCGLPPGGAYTTVMNWQAHKPVVYGGTKYGQKDEEFEKFVDLPRRVEAPFELAVNGKAVPVDRLTASGWRIRSFRTTKTHSAFIEYLAGSRGEFSVAKGIYVQLTTGWFSDRSAAYLASGRPVVLQDTGFSAHLPCGKGLFAVNSLDEAVEAVQTIEADWTLHSHCARLLAERYLDTDVLLPRFLRELNIP